MIIRYPLTLYRAGWNDLEDSVTVLNKQQEADARRDGYRMLSEPIAPPVVAAEADDDDGRDDDTPDAPRRRGRPRKAI
jgi:hypothetical protein